MRRHPSIVLAHHVKFFGIILPLLPQLYVLMICLLWLAVATEKNRHKYKQAVVRKHNKPRPRVAH